MRPPSVDSLAKSLNQFELPHQLKVEAARRSIANNDFENVSNYAKELLAELLRPVINGTGVLIHTNLGRSPLENTNGIKDGFAYSTLEYDLPNGKRGSRSEKVGGLIAKYIGAESALVVNNGAAAVFLVLAAIAQNKAVIISRGELVEIGGGFRIPDVLKASGAQLIEVGTTNKTRLKDYQDALSGLDDPIILKVHSSNYKLTGFTQSVSVTELKSLNRPIVYDIGSGLLDENAPWLGWPKPSWLKDEPGARQTLDQGADIVTFSGDKLMGGPQAGIIAGMAQFVESCAKHPLYRAMRPGNLVLTAVQDTMFSYLDNRADTLPLWAMAKVSTSDLKSRAEAIGCGNVVELSGTPGGGSLPGQEIASYGISLPGDLTLQLRNLEIPIIARMAGSDTVIDLRTVHPSHDQYIYKSVSELLNQSSK